MSGRCSSMPCGHLKIYIFFQGILLSEFGGGSKGPLLTGHKPWFMERGPGPQGAEANGCSVQSQWSKGPVHALVFKGPGSKGPRPGVQVVLIIWPYRLSKLVISLFLFAAALYGINPGACQTIGLLYLAHSWHILVWNYKEGLLLLETIEF